MQRIIPYCMVAGARDQQWRLPQPLEGDPLPSVDLPPALKAMLFRRGLQSQDQVLLLLNDQPLPAADRHFPELKPALRRLKKACLIKLSLIHI